VKAETFVTEELAEGEEITRDAAKIQNVERRRPIEPEPRRARYLHADPVVRVFVSVDLSCVRPIGIMYAQPNQLRPINGAENPSRAYRMCPTASVLPQAFRRVASKELLKFL